VNGEGWLVVAFGCNALAFAALGFRVVALAWAAVL
jgi:hypothetical protein